MTGWSELGDPVQRAREGAFATLAMGELLQTEAEGFAQTVASAWASKVRPNVATEVFNQALSSLADGMILRSRALAKALADPVQAVLRATEHAQRTGLWIEPDIIVKLDPVIAPRRLQLTDQAVRPLPREQRSLLCAWAELHCERLLGVAAARERLCEAMAPQDGLAKSSVPPLRALARLRAAWQRRAWESFRELTAQLRADIRMIKACCELYEETGWWRLPTHPSQLLDADSFDTSSRRLVGACRSLLAAADRLARAGAEAAPPPLSPNPPRSPDGAVEAVLGELERQYRELASTFMTTLRARVGAVQDAGVSFYKTGSWEPQAWDLLLEPASLPTMVRVTEVQFTGRLEPLGRLPVKLKEVTERLALESLSESFCVDPAMSSLAELWRDWVERLRCATTLYEAYARARAGALVNASA